MLYVKNVTFGSEDDSNTTRISFLLGFATGVCMNFALPGFDLFAHRFLLLLQFIYAGLSSNILSAKRYR